MEEALKKNNASDGKDTPKFKFNFVSAKSKNLTEEQENTMAKWKPVIEAAKKQGIKFYDFMGMEPQDALGVSYFIYNV